MFYFHFVTAAHMAFTDVSWSVHDFFSVNNSNLYLCFVPHLPRIQLGMDGLLIIRLKHKDTCLISLSPAVLRHIFFPLVLLGLWNAVTFSNLFSMWSLQVTDKKVTQFVIYSGIVALPGLL